jgi:hypothetical protein
VIHTCNSSYSGGRDQEDHGFKAIVSKNISQKNSTQSRAGGVAQCVGPEFKPQQYKKKKLTSKIGHSDPPILKTSINLPKNQSLIS